MTSTELLNICRYLLKISNEDLTSKSRKERIVSAKSIVCYILNKYSNKTMTDIAPLVGTKDHSSVHHHVRKMSELKREQDPLLYDNLTRVENYVLSQLKNFSVQNEKIKDSCQNCIYCKKQFQGAVFYYCTQGIWQGFNESQRNILICANYKKSL